MAPRKHEGGMYATQKKNQIGNFNIPEGIKDKFDEKLIEPLETYVKEKQELDDIEAVVALFKLYSFYPEKENKTIIETTQLKALQCLPKQHYTVLTCILNTKTEKLKKIQEMADALETCQFKKFWEIREKEKKDINEMINEKTFDANIRTFIMNTIKNTYQTMETKTLKEMMGTEDIENILDKTVTQEGTHIHFAKGKFNKTQYKNRDRKVDIPLAKVLSVISYPKYDP
mmetsp:Transcript_13861/g.20980  ORF Transcript_13861/g.20980 Transcript_13861/m.20980 type:complete len:229 (+) Transcript_13861:48-734(+)